MSMLAEPRYKKKWSLNPRGNNWTNDQNKIGQKLLEMMGWSEGKGLGRDEQGNIEPVRLNYKCDTKGVGYKGHDDEWLSHKEDFDSILSQLNGTEAPVNEAETTSIKSLEMRSKNSRARVHYHKFTRGKDLSGYSSSDLACILGIRNNHKSDLMEVSESSSSDNQEGAREDIFEHSHGVMTIQKSSSIHDYFAQKMAALKEKQGPAIPTGVIKDTEGEQEVKGEHVDADGDVITKKRVRFNDDLNVVKEFSAKKKIITDSVKNKDVSDVKLEEKKTIDENEESASKAASNMKKLLKRKKEKKICKENLLEANSNEAVSTKDVDSSDKKAKKSKKKVEKCGNGLHDDQSITENKKEPMDNVKEVNKCGSVLDSEETLPVDAKKQESEVNTKSEGKKKRKNRTSDDLLGKQLMDGKEEHVTESEVRLSSYEADSEIKHVDLNPKEKQKKKKKKRSIELGETLAAEDDEDNSTRKSKKSKRETRNLDQGDLDSSTSPETEAPSANLEEIRKTANNKSNDWSPEEEIAHGKHQKRKESLQDSSSCSKKLKLSHAPQQECGTEDKTLGTESTNPQKKASFAYPGMLLRPDTLKKAESKYTSCNFERFVGSNLHAIVGYGYL